MLRFFIRRVLLAALTMFVVSVTTFGLFFAVPADPALTMCGARVCPADQAGRIRTSLGLDRPIPVQYAEYMRGIFVGRDVGTGADRIHCPAPCLGVSFRNRLPVLSILAKGFPVTISIVIGGAIAWLSLGLLLGTTAALRRGSAVDRFSIGFSLTGASTQVYVLGLMLTSIFVYELHWLPRPTYTPLFDNPVRFFSGMLLPWITLALINSATYSRLSRAQMLETLSEDFVRTARAKGASLRTVNYRHALRAAITPIVTIFGLELGGSLGGVVITETTFNMRGIGQIAVEAVQNLNLPVVMATVLIAAFFVIASNVVVDMLYAVIDPRVRLG